MSLLAAIVAFFLIAVVLWDSFETIVLPRRVTRKFRLTRFFYHYSWLPWSALARHLRPGNRRESFLSFYGPLSMFLLFSIWALTMIFAFALLHWAIGSPLASYTAGATFWTDLYMSGTTFFTLGLGDVTPRTGPARVFTVMEAGIGFGFLAMVITYLPVLYEAFSRREVNISLLDARAGSPPTAGELIRRHFDSSGLENLAEFLKKWEASAAELMESHLSYPVLCYYRSQHSNQSWLAALATVMDSCALLIAYSENPIRWQAGLTFAISRHAIVDLAQVLHVPPQEDSDRLADGDLKNLLTLLSHAGIRARDGSRCDQEFADLRRMYDPYLNALSKRLLMPLPQWEIPSVRTDNWQTSAWKRGTTDSTGALIEEH